MSGWAARPTVEASTPDWFTQAGTCVIYIHGYNVTTRKAHKAYAQFIEHFDDSFPVAGVYWPGDARLGWFSFLSYPWEIPTACTCAERLLTYLLEIQRIDQARRFHVVCHSLGARLLLELLKSAPLGELNIATIHLMAAAVPTMLISVGQDLAIGDDKVPRRRVYYSDDDTTLQFAFPTGQLAAAGLGLEKQIYFEAVGRFGNPSTFTPYRTARDGNGHGHYWKDTAVARQVGQDLGMAFPVRPTTQRPPSRSTEPVEMSELPAPAAREMGGPGRLRRAGIRS